MGESVSQSDDNKFFLLFSNLLWCKLVNRITLSSLILSGLLSATSSSVGQTSGKTILSVVNFRMVSLNLRHSLFAIWYFSGRCQGTGWVYKGSVWKILDRVVREKNAFLYRLRQENLQLLTPSCRSCKKSGYTAIHWLHWLHSIGMTDDCTEALRVDLVSCSNDFILVCIHYGSDLDLVRTRH